MRIYLVYHGITVAFAKQLFDALLMRVPETRDLQVVYDHSERQWMCHIDAVDSRTLERVIDAIRAVGVAPHHAVLAEQYTPHTEHTARTITEVTHWVNHPSPKAVDIRPYLHQQIGR